MTGTTTDEQQAARDLVALYAERIRLTRVLARAEHPTGAMADAALSVGRRLDEACETFRRRFYPRAGRVFVGLYSVMATSPKGRTSRTLYDGMDEFGTQPEAS